MSHLRPAWLDAAAGAVVLTIHVQPGAKAAGVAGTYGDALKIRIAAPPVDGRANEALLDFLASRLGVPRRAVSLVAGESSRRKRVRVDGATADAVVARLA